MLLMKIIMDYWSVFNTIVIMLALGLAYDNGKNTGAWRHVTVESNGGL